MVVEAEGHGNDSDKKGPEKGRGASSDGWLCEEEKVKYIYRGELLSWASYIRRRDEETELTNIDKRAWTWACNVYVFCLLHFVVVVVILYNR